MIISFATAGASYIAAGARSDLAQLAEEVRLAARAAHRAEPTFLALHLDVTDRQSVQVAAARVDQEFGHLDIVVNNAGILGKFGLVHESNVDEWLDVLQVNLVGPYLVSRSFLPLLLKGQDQYLINVTSVAAHLVNPALSAYQTSKSALVRFSQLLNKEYSSMGVTCFSIHPGNSPTDIMGGPEGLNEHEKLGKGNLIKNSWPP
jgi:NAD(P)-dependent dehydrogenase (short-subunit alcohol dehydrogenase family)